jgi:transcription factor IIIB subunit 2
LRRQTGRRPTGICGACLLIAARMHGFQRSQAEIAAVVKIGGVTLKKRLEEFVATPIASLTTEQFEQLNFDPGIVCICTLSSVSCCFASV